MSTPHGYGIESLALRRASVVDADKVRYRVYRTADDFIAVIAESALMAVKVSGITEPYRIVRDLPSEGITIQAEKMAQRTDEHVNVATAFKEKMNFTTMAREAAPTDANFVPMRLRDFERGSSRRLRVLPPDTVMEFVAKPASKPAPPPALPPEPIAEAAPVAAAPAEVIVEAVPIEPTPAAPAPEAETLSPEEVAKLLAP